MANGTKIFVAKNWDNYQEGFLILILILKSVFKDKDKIMQLRSKYRGSGVTQ